MVDTSLNAYKLKVPGKPISKDKVNQTYCSSIVAKQKLWGNADGVGLDVATYWDHIGDRTEHFDGILVCVVSLL